MFLSGFPIDVALEWVFTGLLKQAGSFLGVVISPNSITSRWLEWGVWGLWSEQRVWIQTSSWASIQMKTHVVFIACFQVTETPVVLSRSIRCTSPPPGRHLVAQKTSASPVFHTNSKLSLWPHTNTSFLLVKLTWLVSVRRGTDWGNQAGEGGEKAAGVDEARTASKGERFVGSKQTSQEPRWAECTV